MKRIPTVMLLLAAAAAAGLAMALPILAAFSKPDLDQKPGAEARLAEVLGHRGEAARADRDDPLWQLGYAAGAGAEGARSHEPATGSTSNSLEVTSSCGLPDGQRSKCGSVEPDCTALKRRFGDVLPPPACDAPGCRGSHWVVVVGAEAGASTPPNQPRTQASRSTTTTAATTYQTRLSILFTKIPLKLTVYSFLEDLAPNRPASMAWSVRRRFFRQAGQPQGVAASSAWTSGPGPNPGTLPASAGPQDAP